MRFSGRWRDYQERVLAEFETLLADRRVHVVAAPGSGKTVLGLELVRRLAAPALILAPTRTIRDQWSARLAPLFLRQPPAEGEVSSTLDAPSQMTLATYQALHGIWAEEGGVRFRALCERLGEHHAITLVLDEAHHLRREWWSALEALIAALPQVRLIALTATPPYDAPFVEWTRYEAMCGPIDLEIGVPELVRNGDLCPHQDHVIFSAPDADTLALLDRRRRAIAALQADLRADVALLDFFESHPWLTDPKGHAEQILDAPEVLSSVLVHLAAAGRKLPRAPLALLGIRAGEIQAPSAVWLEILLNTLLFRMPETFPIGDHRIKWLRAALHEHGLITGGAVRLGQTRADFALTAQSLAKLDSIVTIAEAEAENLGTDLRMVVLTDHVRAGELASAPRADYQPAKLGVVPIFERLRRAAIPGQRLAVLTGSLAILPESAAAAFARVAHESGIADSGSLLKEMAGCPGHLKVEASGGDAHRMVELFTTLFCRGELTLLVGTQSLLGEGWDAPAINSLILASNSAAFMLSNQMRGRAIRIDPARPDKVANIWHLATLERLPRNPVEQWADRLNWGYLNNSDAITSDFDLLCRRFRAFEGIANSDSTLIESGLMRLAWSGAGGIEQANAFTLGCARERDVTASRWRRSLGDASSRAHVRDTASPNYAPRHLSWSDTLGWLGASAVSSGITAAAYELGQITDNTDFAALGAAAGGAMTLAVLPKLAKAAWLAARNGSLEQSLRQVGRAVVVGLNRAGVISEAESVTATFRIRRSLSGRIDIVVDGVSRAAERAIISAIGEILGPVQNPRYLLERRSWLIGLVRSDYHAVPAAIGQRKEFAEAFCQAWRNRVGNSRLVFTRTSEGRIALLRSRARSFAAGFQRRVDRRSAWL
jgi:superfamily II DNA or RNA helicase